MPETARGLYYPPETGQLPDVPADVKKHAESVEALLTAAEGKLLIAQNTGAAAFKAMSGDVAINASGVTQIGSNKLATAMHQDKSITLAKLAEALGLTEGYLADAAATSRKVKLTSGALNASESKIVAGEEIIVPGTTLNITPLVASIIELYVSFYFVSESEGGGNLHSRGHGTVQLDGVVQTGVVRFGADLATGGSIRGSVSRGYRLPLTAGAHTIRLGAIADSLIGSNLQLGATDTGYTYQLFAS